MHRPRSLLILDSLLRVEMRLDHMQRRQAEAARRLAAVERALNLNTVNDIIQQEATMSALDDLEAKAQAQTTVIDGVKTTLQALRDELADALEAGDTGRIQAVIDQIDANTDALADAIADVPAEPGDGGGEPPAEPEPEPGT